MEEKTTKELWEDIERKNLEDALNAEPGSEEGKQAFKQATDAHNIREKENQIERKNPSGKSRLIFSRVLCLALLRLEDR